MGDAEQRTASRPAGVWHAVRLDPTHAAEIAVLFALPQLTPHVAKWAATNAARHPADPPERRAARVLRRSTNVARRGGLITGSSFYVGMLPATAMIYLEQLVVVLRIAAVFGQDPTDPARAAEVLVVQGRYQTLSEASAALRTAGTPGRDRRAANDARTLVHVIEQLPAMIGLRVRNFTARSPIDMIIAGVEVASFFVPVVSLPVWAVANARATRRLGHAAVDFYRQGSVDPQASSAIVLPPRPRRRTRRLVIATVVPLALAVGVLLAFLPIGRYSHHLRWVGFAIGELALVLIFVRLIRLTRIEAPPGAPARQ